MNVIEKVALRERIMQIIRNAELRTPQTSSVAGNAADDILTEFERSFEIEAAARRLHAYGMKGGGYHCPPTWTAHWREWYRKLARIAFGLEPE